MNGLEHSSHLTVWAPNRYIEFPSRPDSADRLALRRKKVGSTGDRRSGEGRRNGRLAEAASDEGVLARIQHRSILRPDRGLDGVVAEQVEPAEFVELHDLGAFRRALGQDAREGDPLRHVR
jgi:hypothetical protein